MVRGSKPFIAPSDAPAVMSVIADTSFDLRQYSIEGPSGFLNVGPPEFRPKYHPSQMTLEWSNGCRALLFSAEDPEVTRGASGSFFWWDELAKGAGAELGWNNMLFGMREGKPRGIVTTTPRPVPILKRLLKAQVHVHHDRLDVGELRQSEPSLLRRGDRAPVRYAHGAAGDQRRTDRGFAGGAVDAHDDRRRQGVQVIPDMSRIVVAIDPSGARTMTDDASSSIGIVVCGEGRRWPWLRSRGSLLQAIPSRMGATRN